MDKIIGQEKTKKSISKIFTIFKNSEAVIRPHFILTGPSGSGKSHIIKIMCDEFKLHFIEVNAAQLTKEGTSGNSLSKVLTPLMRIGKRPTIVFVDEFDKLFLSGNSNESDAHESTIGVQNEFLKILESNTTSVFGDYGKYISVSCNNVLFIFAGAFNNEEDINLDRLRELGLKTEFLGRVNIIYNVEKLSLDDLYAIVDSSELLEQYCQLFENVDKNEVAEKIKLYLKNTIENNSIGARLISALIHQYFINGKLDDTIVSKSSFSKPINNTLTLE